MDVLQVCKVMHGLTLFACPAGVNESDDTTVLFAVKYLSAMMNPGGLMPVPQPRSQNSRAPTPIHYADGLGQGKGVAERAAREDISREFDDLRTRLTGIESIVHTRLDGIEAMLRRLVDADQSNRLQKMVDAPVTSGHGATGAEDRRHLFETLAGRGSSFSSTRSFEDRLGALSGESLRSGAAKVSAEDARGTNYHAHAASSTASSAPMVPPRPNGTRRGFSASDYPARDVNGSSARGPDFSGAPASSVGLLQMQSRGAEVGRKVDGSLTMWQPHQSPFQSPRSIEASLHSSSLRAQPTDQPATGHA